MKLAHTAIAVLAMTLLSTLAPEAQQSKPFAPAPVPPQIAAGKKIFISNAGNDITSAYFLVWLGDPDRTYNQFYSACKSWGRFELVSSPSDADLVFAIRFAEPIAPGSIPSSEPHFDLTILDAKTHFTLWALVAKIDRANRKATSEKNFNQGMDKLMEALKKISGEAAGPQASPK